jgi:hypothetical protein
MRNRTGPRNNHINNIVASANQAQGMLRRNIKKAPQHTKAMAVNTLIRPKVEYSSAVWDPYKCHFPLSFPFNKFI